MKTFKLVVRAWAVTVCLAATVIVASVAKQMAAHRPSENESVGYTHTATSTVYVKCETWFDQWGFPLGCTPATTNQPCKYFFFFKGTCQGNPVYDYVTCICK